MYIGVTFTDGKPIYRQLAETIRGDIESGKMRPGTKLPTVRELSEQLGIARGTIKRAYDELARLGAVEMTQGRGTFVRRSEREEMSRKERAMTAIDSLLETLEELSFSPAEMAIFFDLKLKERTNHDCDVRIAVIENSPEILFAMTDGVYSIEGADVFTYTAESMAHMSQCIGNGIDLIIVRSDGCKTLSVDAENKKTVIKAGVDVDRSTVARLARLGKGVSAAVIALSDTCLEDMMRKMREYAPKVHACGKTVAPDAAIGDVLANKNVIVVPDGYMTLFSRKTAEEINAASKRAAIIQFRYAMDSGTLMSVRDAVHEIRKKRRLGIT